MPLPPDPEEMNRKRAHWAWKAVEAFKADTGQLDEENETVLSDLLADLHHYADEHGIDFQRCLERAAFHYSEETADV